MDSLVSIVMPSYNTEKYISQSISSILSQTYKNWELIIVDDYSEDNSVKAIQSFNDPRIRLLQNHKNLGAAISRNIALREAQGKWIAFLDSDDVWLEDKLLKQLRFMKKFNIAFSCTSYEQIDEKGNLLNRVVKTLPRIDYNRLLLDCPVGNSTVMYNVEKMGKFKVPNIRKRNDDALWLQMLKKEKYIYGMKEVLMKYRIRKNSISSNKLNVIKYHWMLYRDIEHLSIPRSIFHIIYWCIIKILRIK